MTIDTWFLIKKTDYYKKIEISHIIKQLFFIFFSFSYPPHFIEWKNRNSVMCIEGNKKKVLKCLCEYDYLRPIEIARLTHIHKNTVSNVLSELKKEGLVICLNPDYHVPRLYRITREGKKKIEKS